MGEKKEISLQNSFLKSTTFIKCSQGGKSIILVTGCGGESANFVKEAWEKLILQEGHGRRNVYFA